MNVLCCHSFGVHLRMWRYFCSVCSAAKRHLLIVWTLELVIWTWTLLVVRLVWGVVTWVVVEVVVGLV